MQGSSNKSRIHFLFIAPVTLLLVGSLTASEQIEVGYRDFSYPEGTGSNSKPSGEKPESKLWFNDGFWWGILWSTAGNAYRIHWLDRTTQDWLDTGTVVDARSKSRVDAGWDGTHLYVASHIYAGTGAPVTKESDRGKLYRFSYDVGTKTYTLDAGFPVDITHGKSETLVLAKDTTGQLWVTYVESNRVMVNHSVGGDDRTWATPFALPGANANTLDKDDIASIIAYDGHVGIMWSRQTYNNLSRPTRLPNPRSGREEGDSDHLASITMNFAVHDDGAAPSAWSSGVIYTSSGDDHINLKAFDGHLYAAIKTAGDAKVIGLLTCPTAPSGGRNKADWRHYPVYKTGDNDGESPQAELQALSQFNPSRPILLIDADRARAETASAILGFLGYRTTVTDGAGRYAIVDLRPGTYVVTFTLAGFRSVRQEGVELSSSFTATVNATLKVGAVAETVTVTGESPIIDVQQTQRSQVLTREVLDSVPTSRSIWGQAVLATGVNPNAVR